MNRHQNLKERIRQRDPFTFKKIYQDHYENLLRFIIQRGADQQHAEDLVQRSMLILIINSEKPDTVIEEHSLRAYLRRIIFYQYLSDTRKNPKEKTQPLPDDFELSGEFNEEQFIKALEETEISEELIKDQQIQQLYQCIQHLDRSRSESLPERRR